MCVACAHMYEDTCKIHKEMFTYSSQEMVLRVKEEELEFYIFYCISSCTVWFLNQVYVCESYLLNVIVYKKEILCQ